MRESHRERTLLIARLRGAIFDFVHPRLFYGWTVLGVAGLGLFASGPGQSHTFSVFVEPIGRDLGVSNASVASAYGLATLVAALLLPRMGRYVDRLGPRRMTVTVACLLAVACLAFGAAANFLWLAVGFGVLRFLGQGSLMLCSAHLVSHWFSGRRGLAMSLMALGFAASMAIHPPLSQYLVSELGWRQAWVALGALSWVCIVPPMLLLVHDKPEDVGLSPDGEERSSGAEVAESGEKVPLHGLTLQDALHTPAFYILATGWFAIAMLVTTLHFYQVSILTTQGVSADVAASVFTLSA
ncbi:MAG: MFS transporter, partial [Gammaproteobacteria bacterium]